MRKGPLRVLISPIWVKEAVGCQRALWVLLITLLNKEPAGPRQAFQRLHYPASGNLHSVFPFLVTFDKRYCFYTYHSDALFPLNVGLS